MVALRAAVYATADPPRTYRASVKRRASIARVPNTLCALLYCKLRQQVPLVTKQSFTVYHTACLYTIIFLCN